MPDSARLFVNDTYLRLVRQLDVHLEQIDKVRTFCHGLLTLRKAESPVFVIVALAQNVFHDAKFFVARQMFVVVKDEPINHFTDVFTT